MKRPLVALLLVAVALQSQTGLASYARAYDDSAHAGLSIAFFATKAQLENLTFSVKPGFHSTYGIPVYNNGTSPITNVTLIVWFSQGVKKWEVGPTFAGDPPGEVYAAWPEVAPDDYEMTYLEWTASAEEGPFSGDFLVLFEREGVASYSRTHIEGTIDDHLPGDLRRGSPEGGFLFALIGVIGIAIGTSAGYLLGRRRKRT